MPFKTGPNAPLGIPNPYGSPSGTPDTTAQVPIGTIATFVDETQGPCEFIYLPGVANTAKGDIVLYSLAPGAQSTTRHTNATGSNSGRPVAFALQPILASQFGWYQIGGLTLVSAVAGTVAGVMMATATAGSVGNTADAGDQILGAYLLTAVGTPEASKSYAMISRPCVQGQIT